MLSVQNLEVVYQDVILVLRGVSFEIPKGKIVALLGSNGSGKTTTLRAITGLLDTQNGDITKGTISIEGEDITNAPPSKIVEKGIAQVLEGRRIFSELTVLENLKLGGFTASDTVQENVERVYDLFPILQNRGKNVAGYLSGGEQQMLAIGRALMSNPKYLLLDEPSLGLAPKLVEQIAELIKEINSQGVTVLLVEQNANMALKISDHGYIMETGYVVMDNPSEKLLADQDVREFYLGLNSEGTERKSFKDVKHYKRKKKVAFMSSIIKFENVSLNFGGVNALSEVSFEVFENSLFSIIGPNGAGKTSIFNCISGIYTPTKGNVKIFNEDIKNLKPDAIANLGVSRTFQNIELFENMTTLDNILIGAHRHINYGSVSGLLFTKKARREEEKARKIAEDVIDFLEIEEYRYSFILSLPYGIQKRIELGRALAMQPKVLLLDEPAAGMNNEETEDIARFILDIHEELGITVVLIDHDMNMVMDIATEVIVMDFGKKLFDGSPRDAANDASVIEAYLGVSD